MRLGYDVTPEPPYNVSVDRMYIRHISEMLAQVYEYAPGVHPSPSEFRFTIRYFGMHDGGILKVDLNSLSDPDHRGQPAGCVRLSLNPLPAAPGVLGGVIYIEKEPCLANQTTPRLIVDKLTPAFRERLTKLSVGRSRFSFPVRSHSFRSIEHAIRNIIRTSAREEPSWNETPPDCHIVSSQTTLSTSWTRRGPYTCTESNGRMWALLRVQQSTFPHVTVIKCPLSLVQFLNSDAFTDYERMRLQKLFDRLSMCNETSSIKCL